PTASSTASETKFSEAINSRLRCWRCASWRRALAMSGSTSASRSTRHLSPRGGMFEPGHLREPALVTSTLEWRLEPGAHDGDRVVQRRRAAGEREHVEVVVLTRKTGRLDIAAHASPDAGHFVRGDDHADPGSAHEETALRLARAHGDGNRSGGVRIIDGIRGVRARIHDAMSFGNEPFLEVLLEREPGVIGSDRDHSHTSATLPVGVGSVK